MEKVNIKVNYYNQNLDSFPDKMFDQEGKEVLFKEITELNLANNLINEIPNTIELFENLKVLRLGGNKLTQLPKEIGKLKLLEELDISENSIENLPVEIGGLKNLKIFYAHTNRIANIPDTIGELKSLEEIDFAYNQIFLFPSEIANCTSLVKFSIPYNKLNHLPGEIENLINLTDFQLHNNQILELPVEIGNLKNLITLTLSNNLLASLPDTIGKLTNLKILYINNNPIEKLPYEIQQLTKLEKIDLRNILIQIPEEVDLTSPTCLYYIFRLTLTDNLLHKVKIKRLVLKNIGHFEDLSIDFDENITCLVGENGTGKSTILKSIGLALLGKDYEELTTYLPALQRIVAIEDNKEIYGQCSVRIEFSIDSIRFYNYIQITFKDEDRKFYFGTDGHFNLVRNKFDLVSLIVGFPQTRDTSLSSSDFSEDLTQLPHVSDLAPIITNHDYNSLNSFNAWIIELYFAALESIKDTDNKWVDTNEGQIIKTVFEIISRLTNDKIEFLLVRKIFSQEIWVTTKAAPNGIPLDYVSHGFKLIMAWLGFFLKRIMEAYSYLDYKTALEQHHILIIDEIDTSIHPVWQAEILNLLKEIFPNTQFILSTHSALSVYGLKKEQIIKLHFNSGIVTAQNEITDNWAWKYEEILSRTFNTQYRLLKKVTIDELNQIIFELENIPNKLPDQEKELGSLLNIRERLLNSIAEVDILEKRKQLLDKREKELDERLKMLLESENKNIN